MEKKKKAKKGESGSVKIDPSVLKEAKVICKKEGYLISRYVTEAVKAYNQPSEIE